MKDYDYELEWIGSDSTAKIDTGIVPTADTVVECCFYHEKHINYANYFVQEYVDEATNTFRVILGSSAGTGYATGFAKAGGGSTPIRLPLYTYNVIRMTGARCTVNGTTYELSTAAGNGNSGTIILFDSRKANTNRDIGARCKYFRVLEGDRTVLDLVPVVRGGTVCMYDKVSGGVFESINSSKFIAGPEAPVVYEDGGSVMARTMQLDPNPVRVGALGVEAPPTAVLSPYQSSETWSGVLSDSVCVYMVDNPNTVIDGNTLMPPHSDRIYTITLYIRATGTVFRNVEWINDYAPDMSDTTRCYIVALQRVFGRWIGFDQGSIRL